MRPPSQKDTEVRRSFSEGGEDAVELSFVYGTILRLRDTESAAPTMDSGDLLLS
jgi:hypothetical protein